MQKYTNPKVKHTLLDLFQFHKANCKDSECDIRPSVMIEVFDRLGISLTEDEYNILIKV